MKRLYPALALVCLSLSLLFSSRSFSQNCPDGEPPRAISYDTAVTGGGNDNFAFTFAQFDPSLGTLVGVKLETVVTLKYRFSLENNNASAFTYKVKVTREDGIEYPGGQIDHSDFKNVGTYALPGTDGIPGSGPDYKEDGPIYAFNQLHSTYNLINNVAGFLGSSAITINYTTNSFANALGSLNNSLTGEAEDSVGFKITYLYCPSSLLPANISNFSATRLSSGNIQLNWLAPNDAVGKRYEIQKSADAKSFTAVESILYNTNGSGNYSNLYHTIETDKNKLFFRVKEYADGNAVKYSAVKAVTLGQEAAAAMKVYPTMPTDAVNVLVPGTAKGDWQVKIISMAGQVMQQSEFYKSNFLKLVFNQKLPSGLYIVEVINKNTLESQKSKIIIQ